MIGQATHAPLARPRSAPPSGKFSRLFENLFVAHPGYLPIQEATRTSGAFHQRPVEQNRRMYLGTRLRRSERSRKNIFETACRNLPIPLTQADVTTNYSTVNGEMERQAFMCVSGRKTTITV